MFLYKNFRDIWTLALFICFIVAVNEHHDVRVLLNTVVYDYIASYSPYDNLTAAPYPAVLATGGLSDPRVTYWEPAKWAAKLREFTTSGDPILLKINMEAGHGGASGRFDFLKEIALDYAFAIWAVEKGWEKA